MNRELWDLMNRILDDEVDPETWQGFAVHLDESPADSAVWDRMREVDRLLRQEPMAAPPAGFAARVMSQVRGQAEAAPRADGFTLAIRLTVIALIGLVVMLGAYFLLTRFIGSVDWKLVEEQARALLVGIDNLLRLVADWAEEYPMLPAIGLASIPLAFAALWLAVYYTPKDRLRELVSRRLTLIQ